MDASHVECKISSVMNESLSNIDKKAMSISNDQLNSEIEQNNSDDPITYITL